MNFLLIKNRTKINDILINLDNVSYFQATVDGVTFVALVDSQDGFRIPIPLDELTALLSNTADIRVVDGLKTNIPNE